MNSSSAVQMVPAFALTLALVLVGGSIQGCKQKDAGAAATADAAQSNELNAINHTDIARFSDEIPVPNTPTALLQSAVARTTPNDKGTVVQSLSVGHPVLKVADRTGFSLVTFDSGTPGRRAGWISNAAFVSPAAAPPPPPVPPSACTRTLRVAGFTPSNPACVLNENVRANSPTAFSFPCAGGPATARFGAQTFTGTASATHISLTNVSTYPLNGCTYKSVQTIAGTPPNLSYSYVESIVSGSCKQSGLCTARATFSAL